MRMPDDVVISVEAHLEVHTSKRDQYSNRNVAWLALRSGGGQTASSKAGGAGIHELPLNGHNT